MATRQPFWKWHCWKSIGLPSIYTSDEPLKFGLDIQSQTKVRVPKPKNPRWPPGGHFDSDIAENQKASAHGHKQYAYKIWNWNSKANLSYAPETMSPTDGRTDGQTDKVNPVYPRGVTIHRATIRYVSRYVGRDTTNDTISDDTPTNFESQTHFS